MRRLLLLLLLLAAVLAVYLALPRAAPPATVRVFFTIAVGNEGTLADVVREVPGGSVEARLRAALEALLSGPSEEERARGLGSEIPEGTRLLGVRVENGIAWVDFTPALGSGGGSSSMLARVWQIVYTATQLPEAGAARILIDGREATALGGEGVLIDQPIERPLKLPTF